MKNANDASLANRLLTKRALLEADDLRHKEIRPLLFVSGGGMRGAYGAGVGLALHHLGVAECFDVVVGISAGAAMCGYFLTDKRNAAHGATIFFEECRAGFIRYAFPFPSIRIEYLAEVIGKGEKRINVGAIHAHRSRFFIGVTHWENGGAALIDAKKAEPDVIAAIIASLALTYAYPTPIIVNGEKYTDGGISNPLPIVELIGKFAPTDILLVSNYSLKESHETELSRKEKIADTLASFRVPRQLRQAFKNRNALWRENFSYVEQFPSRVAILCGADNVGVLTQNLAKLRGATLKGISDTLALFEDCIDAYSLMP